MTCRIQISSISVYLSDLHQPRKRKHEGEFGGRNTYLTCTLGLAIDSAGCTQARRVVVRRNSIDQGSSN